MAEVNHVILIGRLTRDSELKYTSGGMAVCKFSIAVNKRRKNGDQWVEEANFFDIVLWGRAGESLNQYLVKGKQVAVEGELRQNRWEQDGQARSKIEIIANNVQLLGGNSGSGTGGAYGSYEGKSGQGSGYSSQNEGSSYQRQPDAMPDMDDSGAPDFPDDIPF
ncbi:single-stranded DNA-binding protein [Brucepastera parasyntrophica]|uniref:single-stranded DNA-binding protein n=1 Tax=Brucepastera parasyntrophica TaxID=2880008 RepID=UPI003F6F6BC7